MRLRHPWLYPHITPECLSVAKAWETRWAWAWMHEIRYKMALFLPCCPLDCLPNCPGTGRHSASGLKSTMQPFPQRPDTGPDSSLGEILFQQAQCLPAHCLGQLRMLQVPADLHRKRKACTCGVLAQDLQRLQEWTGGWLCQEHSLPTGKASACIPPDTLLLFPASLPLLGG